MVGWPKLHWSMTARALVRRFSKDVIIAGTATAAATLALSAIRDTTMPDGPPRPPADMSRTAIHNEPPATVTVTGRLTEAGPAASVSAAATLRPAPATERSGPRLSGHETTRPVAAGPRLASAARHPAPSGAAISNESPTAAPPLDLSAKAWTSDGPMADAEAERPWTFGSSFRLARTAAETATSRVLVWKQRVTTSTAWLLGALP
jgi:hypothetical protein